MLNAISECKRKIAAALRAPILSHSIFLIISSPQVHELKLFPTAFIVIFTIYCFCFIRCFSFGESLFDRGGDLHKDLLLCPSHIGERSTCLYPDKTPGHPHEFSKYSRHLSGGVALWEA